MKKQFAMLAVILAVAATLVARNSNVVSAASRSSVALHGVPQAGSGPTMIPFSSKEGAFSIKMPGIPKEESQKADTAVGPLVLHIFTLEANAGKFAYLIQYSDFPSVPADPAKALDGTIEGETKSFKGTVLSDNKVTLDGWPGRVVAIKGEAVVCLSSAYMADNRLYQVMFVMENGQTLPPEAAQFLDSFHITLKAASAK